MRRSWRMQAKPRHLWPDYGAQFQDPAVAAQYRKRPPYPAATFDLILQCLPRNVPIAEARILDVGSGTGEIAIPLAERGAAVDAVEPSLAMLDVARQMPGAGKVRWHNISAESFSYSSRYELIICAQCLALLEWDTVLPKFASALAPGGWLVIVGQRALEDLPWIPALKALIAHYSTNQDFQPFDLIDALENRGLFEQHGRAVNVPQPMSQSINDYIDSIHARNGFSRDRMRPSAAREFDAQVQALLLEHHPQGRIEGTNQSTIIWGRPGPAEGSTDNWPGHFLSDPDV